MLYYKSVYRKLLYKPAIDQQSKSFIEATDMRHPIIEKIRQEIKYVPNDVLIGKDNQNGILLYGVNAVGKSSYMKSIGISIIMAQSGFYVSAKKFKRVLINIYLRVYLVMIIYLKANLHLRLK